MGEATPKKTRQQMLNRASGQADRRLKEKHIEEWNGYMVEEAKKAGTTWAPKPTEEEKAKGELEALLKAHPELAQEYGLTPPAEPTPAENQAG